MHPALTTLKMASTAIAAHYYSWLHHLQCNLGRVINVTLHELPGNAGPTLESKWGWERGR